mgnify:CR=1 FL=1
MADADLTKKHIQALEKVFAAEIKGRLPFQSKARIYADLADAGYLEPDARTLSFSDGLPSMTVSGYVLTHAGRYAYCIQCAVVDNAEGVQ